MEFLWGTACARYSKLLEELDNKFFKGVDFYPKKVPGHIAL